MSDFTHARICIRYNSGSVEIQAPAGEVTWLDLSGLHALPIANGKEGRPKRRLLTTFVFLGFSAAAAGGAGVAFMSNSRALSAGTRAEASALERSALLPDFATANAIQAPRALPPVASGPLPQPAASDADPFGLRR